MLKFGSVNYYLGWFLFFWAFLILILGVEFYLLERVIFLEWCLVEIFRVRVVILLLLDWISLIFIGFVLFISSIVLIYRYYYIEGDIFFYRFIILVYLFVLSILLMILRPNLIRILLGWDGLGLVSYCLVIYYQGVKSANAGILTILSNRVGDVAILLGIAWFANYGRWDFFYVQHLLDSKEVSVVLFLIILAGITKRAQIPFSAWLPAAIAAPTPVSALVHSSTLVTAGVYLIIRFNYLLNVSFILFYIGALTMFISGLGANFEIDLKKIIALSTLRQLGVIILVLSLGYIELAFFHLLTHALFKSLLFLCAGGFIHSSVDCQDIRLLGVSFRDTPVSCLFFIFCSLSLCGFPFLSGFYSKDLILEVYINRGIGVVILLIIILGTFFTVRYSIRLGAYVIVRAFGIKETFHFGERKVILSPIRGLFISSLFAGSVISWGFVPCFTILLPLTWKLLILGGVIFTSLLVLIMFTDLGGFYSSDEKGGVSWFLGGIWFIPIISTAGVIVSLRVGEFLLRVVDQGWMEKFGGQGVIQLLGAGGVKLDYRLGLPFKLHMFIFFTLISFLAILLFYFNSSSKSAVLKQLR